MFFSKKSKSLQIMSPVDGIVEAIETVNDPVFSQKMIGDGFAIYSLQEHLDMCRVSYRMEFYPGQFF